MSSKAADTMHWAATILRRYAEAANTTEARRPYGDRRIEPVPESEWANLVGDTYLGGEIGKYCALLHPPVGLAVAAWLEAEADRLAQTGLIIDEPHALTVARAILREDERHDTD